MKRVGRPSLPYKTRHVMINMKDEWYEHMKKNEMNMSEEINQYLDNRFHNKICPTCYGDELEHRQCMKCLGDAIFCANIRCEDHKSRVGNSCPEEMWFGKLRPVCTPDDFFGVEPAISPKDY